MINFLHTFEPSAVLISLGPINIYYYGFFIVCGILLGSVIALKLAEKHGLDKDTVIDSAFWVIVIAIAGGRFYHVLLELPFYLERPWQIFMLWRGGLAIHGVILAGLLAIYFFAKKNRQNPWLLAAIYAPALALGQALGRWGNYFNQELYGLPTDLSWGIPIEFSKRMMGYGQYEYFHPTFLYESFGNLLIAIFLIFIHHIFIKKKIIAYELIIAFYIILYSLLRFSLEFIRIDSTPQVFFLRWPQIASLVLMAIAIYIIIRNKNDFLLLVKKSKKISDKSTT